MVMPPVYGDAELDAVPTLLSRFTLTILPRIGLLGNPQRPALWGDYAATPEPGLAGRWTQESVPPARPWLGRPAPLKGSTYVIGYGPVATSRPRAASTRWLTRSTLSAPGMSTSRLRSR